MGPIGGGQGGLENLETPLSKFCQTFGQDFKGCVEAILQQTIPNFQDSDDVQCIITWCRRAVCGLASQLLVPGRAVSAVNMQVDGESKDEQNGILITYVEALEAFGRGR
eukprot:scaffold145699_cov18-Tisochrysis_lutea.AAC.1